MPVLRSEGRGVRIGVCFLLEVSAFVCFKCGHRHTLLELLHVEAWRRSAKVSRCRSVLVPLKVGQ